MSSADEVKATITEKTSDAFTAVIGEFVNNAVDLSIVFVACIIIGWAFTKVFGPLGVPQLKVGNFVKRHGIFVLGMAAVLAIMNPLLDQFEIISDSVSAWGG